ncbi:coiled-coil domain-containing protein 83 isoform X2 [Brienomyrus brachyistius]|uniref:coiled-coil domain-containing protein 83 isoform X2 n=1 Tax=Brienomyrus brachyistius TaxID=42636 RepID=UPI0020B1BE28|nr:coiled-coil domain-containing protein 83 isoform X2 [Brienomyrus brachyistius]
MYQIPSNKCFLQDFQQSEKQITCMRMQVKRQEIQYFQVEVKQLEEKRQRYIQVGEQLKAEQIIQTKVLLKQERELMLKLEKSELQNKEQVEETLRCDRKLASKREEELAELRSKLLNLEEELLPLQEEKEVYTEYKTVRFQEQQQQILHLENRLSHTQKVFAKMSDHIQHSLADAHSHVDKGTALLVEEEKRLAVERAMKELDEHTKQEFRENEWLKRELAVYKKEASTLELDIESLEKENLEHINDVLENQFSDLHISRNVFLTQTSCLLASDLGNGVETMERADCKYQPDNTGGPSTPLSPTAEAEMVLGCLMELERDEMPSSCSQSAQQPPSPDLSVITHRSQTNIQQHPTHLGPLELKLLTVVGLAAPLHPLPLMQGSPGVQQDSEDWALTARTIQGRFK